MAARANVFTMAWGFQHGGVLAASVGQHVGTELLGASVYELEPEARWAADEGPAPAT